MVEGSPPGKVVRLVYVWMCQEKLTKSTHSWGPTVCGFGNFSWGIYTSWSQDFNIVSCFLHTVRHVTSWLKYKDSMLDSLFLGDVFPLIVMLFWQRGSTRRGQVWIQCKGTHFLPEEIANALGTIQLLCPLLRGCPLLWGSKCIEAIENLHETALQMQVLQIAPALP